MLVAILLVLISRFFLKNLEKKYYNKISLSQNIDESIHIRKHIKIERWFTFAFVLVLYYSFEILIYTYLLVELDISFWCNEVFGSIIVIGFIFNKLRISPKIYNPLAKISLLRKEDVINRKEDYILFLRGFSKDNYESLVKLEHRNYFVSFSEYHLYKAIKNYNHEIGFYAVGMSKEVESANGAERVYLNDFSWKEDVLELMQNAKAIYILLDSRESCIWEIMQTQYVKNKVVFLCDDIKTFQSIKTMLKNNNSPVANIFPDSIASNNFFYFTNSNTNIIEYENTSESYRKLVELELNEIGINKKKKIPTWIKVLVHVIGFLFSQILSHELYEYLCIRSNHKLPLIYNFIFSFCYVLSLFVLLIKKCKKQYFIYQYYKPIFNEKLKSITSCSFKQGWEIMPLFTKCITIIYLGLLLCSIFFITFSNTIFSTLFILDSISILWLICFLLVIERIMLIKFRKTSYYILSLLLIISVLFFPNEYSYKEILLLLYVPLIISYLPYFKKIRDISAISQFVKISIKEYYAIGCMLAAMIILLIIVPVYYGTKYDTKKDLNSLRFGAIDYIRAEESVNNAEGYFTNYHIKTLADDYADKYEFNDNFFYDIEKAIYWNEKALEIEIQRDNSYDSSLADDIAELYESKGDYYKALFYYEQIIEHHFHYLSNGRPSGIVENAFNSIHAILEKYPEMREGYKMPVWDKNKVERY